MEVLKSFVFVFCLFVQVGTDTWVNPCSVTAVATYATEEDHPRKTILWLTNSDSIDSVVFSDWELEKVVKVMNEFDAIRDSR